MGAVSIWEPDTVEALLDMHDIDGGTLVFSARPDMSGPRRGLNDLLAAMGKEVAGKAPPPTEIKPLTELCVAWLIAEQIHTVAVVAVERWPAHVSTAVRLAVESAGAFFIPVSTRSETSLHDAHGHLVEARAAHAGQRCSATPAALRRFRFPHFAAAGLLYRLTEDWSDFNKLTVHDLCSETHSIGLRGTTVAVPIESWRFLRVQEVHSRRAKKRALFTRFGQTLRRDELVFSILKTLSAEDDPA
jgi:hypothetical protein